MIDKDIHVPHNRIHRILKEEGMVKNESKKQKRRKWIRYERKHSNSLWHSDWFEYKDKHIIIFEDDVSRFITGFGLFERATPLNAIKVLDRAIRDYGIPKQVMTDHGIQFTSLPRENCPEPEPNVFQKKLKKYGIRHAKARVKHPQSNGKVDKASDTIMKLYQHFKRWDRTVEYYNFERPHLSLLLDKLETPFQAYLRKMRTRKRIKFIQEHQHIVAEFATEFLDGR